MLAWFSLLYLLENCSGSVFILGFDLFDVTEVNLMSQTLKSLAEMILQSFSTLFSSILLLYFIQSSCVKVAVPSMTPKHYNRL